LFSGFLLPINELNALMQRVADVSYVKATFECQIYAVYGWNRCDPTRGQHSILLYRMDLKESSFQTNITLLLCQVLFWRVLALMCLIVKTNDYKFGFMFNNSNKVVNNRINNSQLAVNKSDSVV